MSDVTDEFELCQNVHPHELDDDIKSNAVVKYSANYHPANFHRLQCNTNLNLPPLNWLNSTRNYGILKAIYNSPSFTSFRMAHAFPDCVGAVDVICDSENIKRLLKLPYNTHSPISMIVHKVGNTLLLDEFDIQKYLLRKVDDDWKWLRQFILEEIFGECKKTINLHDKSRAAIQKKNLLSKFLYHSLKYPGGYDDDGTDIDVEQKPKARPTLPIQGPILPEPKLEENIPNFSSSHAYNRNLVWTFEDIRMLIGSDMPIFGGPNRPCISLRLREMTQPINVLTGIDYWLDNLMCNVPEVLMCYHLDGIVQKYEVIKTEDLPYLEDSKFSPQVVRNVAQNILAFLKANATKSGHTYWLFKGRNDDVVKLYDLTTLCTDHNVKENEPKLENPFTVPVGMLLYSVAKNIKSTSKRVSPKTAGNIKSLLDNCLQLLTKEKYPQIVTSSHYMLSDLYIPSGIDPKDPKFDESDKDSDSLYDEEEMGDDMDDFTFNGRSDMDDQYITDEHNVAIQSITEAVKDVNPNKKHSRQNCHRKPTPLNLGTKERCYKSLEHIGIGMLCLEMYNRNEEEYIKESEARAKEEEKQRILYEEQNPTMAKSCKPIPLPYEQLPDKRRTSVSSSNCSSDQTESTEACPAGKQRKSKSRRRRDRLEAAKNLTKQQFQLLQHQTTQNFNTNNFGSWNVHLKLLLLEKASLAYATLAECSYESEDFGTALKALYLSERCQQIVIKHISEMRSRKGYLLGRAGDCFFQMSKNWSNIQQYLNQFEYYSNYDYMIRNCISSDNGCDESTNDLILPVKHMERLMIYSCQCYRRALELTDKNDLVERHELTRRMGNILNELGLRYMYWSQEEYSRLLASHILASYSAPTNMEVNQEYDNSSITSALNVSPNEMTRAFAIDSKVVHDLVIDAIFGKSSFQSILKGISTDPLNGPDTSDEPKVTEQLPISEKIVDWVKKYIRPDSGYIRLASRSLECLASSIAAFTETKDITNMAFLHCNMGRYMRFRAYLVVPNETLEGLAKQKEFYQESFKCYEKAKELLGSAQKNPNLWEVVNWELGSAVLILAKQMQDNIYLDENADKLVQEKEVLEMLQRALKLCDVDSNGTRQPHYLHRAALIHRRIGNFHFHQLRATSNELNSINKHILQLCKYHFEKSLSILESLRECNDYIIIQMERVTLQEFMAERSSTLWQKIKHMQVSFQIILNSKMLFMNAIEVLSNSSQSVTKSLSEDFFSHTVLFRSRLESTLKTLIKLLLTKKPPKTQIIDMYKRMYKEALEDKRDQVSGLPETQYEYATALRNIIYLLNRLKEIEHQSANNNNTPQAD